jgi:hypothetical protein
MNTLDKIHARVNIMNLIHTMEVKYQQLEMIYASIHSDISQDIGCTEDDYSNTLQNIEFEMSVLDEEYGWLQNSLHDLEDFSTRDTLNMDVC